MIGSLNPRMLDFYFSLASHQSRLGAVRLSILHPRLFSIIKHYSQDPPELAFAVSFFRCNPSHASLDLSPATVLGF